jgi:hypothetical protein
MFIMNSAADLFSICPRRFKRLYKYLYKFCYTMVGGEKRAAAVNLALLKRPIFNFYGLIFGQF